MQRRLAAILAADMVGYSRLIECDEAGTIERLASGIELPVIFTCRPEAEGGCFPGDEAARLAVLRAAIESGVSWIDLGARSF